MVKNKFMIKWINILHFYQPSIVNNEIFDSVVASSYQSWADFLSQYKNVKVTVNFSGCLTERLFNSGYNNLIKQFSKLAKKGQIEFLESAAFHPILPLLPEKEVIHQIQVNNQINHLRFGKSYQPAGFFLPEMAYSDKVAGIIKKLGYKYIVLDPISINNIANVETRHCCVSTQKKIANFIVDPNTKYQTKKHGLNIIFRDKTVSQTFVPETIINIIENNDLPKNPTIITATDSELYGHRYWNWWPAYSHLVKKTKKVTTATASEYLKSIKKSKIISLRASSWESIDKELKNKIPFALWQNPKNKIHTLLWQLANFALQLNWRHTKDPNHFASRLHLENGLASCTFWWASSKDFKELFAPIAWDPNMVEAGARELLNSIRALEKIKPADKLKAEKLFTQIRHKIWGKHWKI